MKGRVHDLPLFLIFETKDSNCRTKSSTVIAAALVPIIWWICIPSHKLGNTILNEVHIPLSSPPAQLSPDDYSLPVSRGQSGGAVVRIRCGSAELLGLQEFNGQGMCGVFHFQAKAETLSLK